MLGKSYWNTERGAKEAVEGNIGFCPECHEVGTTVQLSHDVYGVCHKCETCWCIWSCGETTKAKFEKDAKKLGVAHYRDVEPWQKPPSASAILEGFLSDLKGRPRDGILNGLKYEAGAKTGSPLTEAQLEEIRHTAHENLYEHIDEWRERQPEKPEWTA